MMPCFFSHGLAAKALRRTPIVYAGEEDWLNWFINPIACGFTVKWSLLCSVGLIQSVGVVVQPRFLYTAHFCGIWYLFHFQSLSTLWLCERDLFWLHFLQGWERELFPSVTSSTSGDVMMNYFSAVSHHFSAELGWVYLQHCQSLPLFWTEETGIQMIP